MKNIHIFCEGESDGLFIQQVLPEFFGSGYNITHQVIRTGRHRGKDYKGGVTTYQRFKDQLDKICKEKPNFTVTTLFDYYAFPSEAPKMKVEITDKYAHIVDVEKAIAEDLGNPKNLIVNLVLHEFETFLFSAPEAFDAVSNQGVVDALQAIKQQENNPELINDGKDSAPSKRIERVFKDSGLKYDKKVDGLRLIKQIGLENIKNECRHFSDWIDRLKNV